MTFIDPSKHFYGHDGPLLQRAVDFWKWAYSDLVQNITRGIVAEYLVACSLGLDKIPRQPWESFDLKTKNGKKIEIKSAAYVQAWTYGNAPPKFVISPKKAWTQTEGLTKESALNADEYVLCLHNEKERGKVDPMNIDQWRFWVFSKEEIIKLLNGRKSISIKKLEQVKPVDFSDLGKAIQNE